MTIEVHSEAALRKAAWQSRLGSTTIVLMDNVTIRDTLTFPQSDHAVQLVSNGCTLFCDLFWQGWGVNKRRNAIEARCARFDTVGVRYRNYQDSGSVIRFHGSQHIGVTGCLFTDCCTTQQPDRIDKPETASDTVYGSLVACQNLVGGSVSIVGNRAVRCVWTSRDYSRLWYVSASSVTLSRNVTDQCGNSLGVGGRIPDAVNIIEGNVVDDAHNQWDSDYGRPAPPFLWGGGQMDRAIMRLNTATGDFEVPFTGWADKQRHWIDANNWSGMAVKGNFARVGTGYARTFKDWQALGFDQNSNPPTMGSSVPA